LATFSELDELVQTPVELAHVPALCGQGYRLEVVTCAGADHAGGAVASLPYALRWLRDRLDGVAWPQGGLCQVAAPVDGVAWPQGGLCQVAAPVDCGAL
jgi:hypothetical protein